MSAESKSSKENNDPAIGFVSLQEIQNLWTTKMRQLDKEIWPDRGRMPNRDEIVEFFATLKLDLFRRAQGNYVEFCRRVPDPALARSKKPVAAIAPETPPDESYKARKDRLSKWY